MRSRSRANQRNHIRCIYLVECQPYVNYPYSPNLAGIYREASGRIEEGRVEKARRHAVVERPWCCRGLLECWHHSMDNCQEESRHSPDCWKDPATELKVFTVEEFSEK